tara:strand:- start:437 stop:1057 length:621 start_codon:yes stop_codon:yes gene_type:complete
MEDIEAEIQEKVIEKPQAQQEELKPVVKKPRSEAQKAAFEKARAKRAENLKKKEDNTTEIMSQLETPHSVVEEGVVAEKTKPPPKKRGRPRGSTKAKKEAERPTLPQPTNNPVYQPVNHNIPFNQNTPQNFYQYDPRYQQPPPPPAPVNNYYYYGAPPPKEEPKEVEQQERYITQPQPQEDSSDDYSEEEEEYYEPPSPQLKFRFA